MRFKHIFHPSNWTKLSRVDRDETDDLRRDILFSQILVVGLFMAALHFINDFFHGNTIAYIIDLLFFFLLVLFYYLNEKGAHLLAKFLDLSLLNIILFFLTATTEEQVKMYFNFFPMAILAFLVFYKRELHLSMTFCAISLLLLITLELTNYQPFGDFLIKEGVDSTTTYINVIGSFLLAVMGLTLLVRLNQKAERDLEIKEEHLSKTNKELDRFVYSTSHDLRAPLLSIKGLTNLLKYKVGDPELMEYVDKIDGRV